MGLTSDQFITITYIEGVVDNSYGDGKKFKIVELGTNYIIADGNIRITSITGKAGKVSITSRFGNIIIDSACSYLRNKIKR